MKQKILHSVMTLLSLNVVINTVGCAKVNKPDWNSISLKPPLLDVDVNGFVNTNLDKIDITKYKTVDDLITAIKKCLKNSLWAAKDSIKFTITKTKNNENKIISLQSDERYRNGTYIIMVESNLANAPGIAKFTINVVNSNHLDDVIKIKELGVIDDYLPKTILYNIMLRNLGLITDINEFANYLPPDENLKSRYLDIQIDETAVKAEAKVPGSAILKNLSSKSKNSELKFFGQVKVTFTVELKPPKENHQKIDLSTLPQNENKINWQELSDDKPYTLLKAFITNWFPTKLPLHSHILNEIAVITANTNEDHVKKVTFKAKDLTEIPTYKKLYGDSYFTNQLSLKITVKNKK